MLVKCVDSRISTNLPDVDMLRLPHAMSVQFRCTTHSFPLSLEFKNDAIVPYRTCTNGILRLDAPAIEKIRIDFIDAPLISFSLI